jgi:hypothetical protein
MSATTWNSLEVVKITVGFLTPLAVGVVGWFISRQLATNQELIKKRIQIYDSVAPLLNDIYCHFRCIGDFRSISPPEIVNHKRVLDRNLYVYHALFSSQLFDQYQRLINQFCFRPYTGAGESAKIRASANIIKMQWKEKWQPEWDKYYDEEDIPFEQHDQFVLEYQRLLELFAENLGFRRSRRHFIIELKKRINSLPKRLKLSPNSRTRGGR